MSTLLVTLAVVIVSIAGATVVAVKDPEQPAMLRTRKPRARPPRPPQVVRAKPTARARAAAPVRGARGGAVPSSSGRSYSSVATGPAPPSSAPGPAPRPGPGHGSPWPGSPWPGGVPASAELAGVADHWVPAPSGIDLWLRLRSGVVLTFLLAVVGTLVAAAVAGVIVLLALAVRSAVS